MKRKFFFAICFIFFSIILFNFYNYKKIEIDFQQEPKMNQDFEKWDVRELKKALERLGIDYSDCIEKNDLIEKLKSQNFNSSTKGK